MNKVLQKRGICLASKCQCCQNCERIDYVMCNGVNAKRFWHFYVSKFNVEVEVEEEGLVAHHLRAWFTSRHYVV